MENYFLAGRSMPWIAVSMHNSSHIVSKYTEPNYNATRLWYVFRILMQRKTFYPTYDSQQLPMNKLGTKVLVFKAWVTEL